MSLYSIKIPLTYYTFYKKVYLIFFNRIRAFFHGFNEKAGSIDRCIDNICFLPSDDALYLLTDASITHKVDADTLDSLDEVCIVQEI